MDCSFRQRFRRQSLRLATSLSLAAIIAVAVPLFGQTGGEDSKASTSKKTRLTPPPEAVEIRFAEGGTMKVLLRDERIELETPYGRLMIPIAEIHRIDFGLRMSDEIRKKLDTAIADLGNTDYDRRQAASTDLLAMREKAFPALVKAAKGKDQEVVRRAEQIIENLRETVSEEDLEIPAEDIVHTATSKIAGQIKLSALKIGTRPFGEQQVKLTDIRVLRSLAVPNEEPQVAGAALPDPGNMHAYANQIGKTLSFRVTGPPPGIAAQMGVFGTDVYTTDSSLAGAAVHAGAIQPGKTGIVRVTIVGQHAGFQPSIRNGVTSAPWGTWTGFRIEVAKGGGAKR
jgi:hypothetical protein